VLKTRIAKIEMLTQKDEVLETIRTDEGYDLAPVRGPDGVVRFIQVFHQLDPVEWERRAQLK
jgi:hypothetical protein